MAMKAPPAAKTNNLQVQQILRESDATNKERKSIKMSTKTYAMQSTATSRTTTTPTHQRADINFLLGDMPADNDDDDDNDDDGVTMPQLLQLVAQKPRLRGNTRSQDNDDADSQLLAEEQRFGSVSPILPSNNDLTSSSPHNRHGNMSAMGAARASNFRLKFRKSHTCGSLFANCNCSSTTALPIAIHETRAPATPSSSVKNERQPLAALPKSLHLSISPSHTEEPSGSSGLGTSLRSNSTSFSSSLSAAKLLGSFSLSTTTNTSAQLSRDDDVDVVEYVACDAAAASTTAAIAVNDERNVWSSLVGVSPANSAHATHKPIARSRISSPTAPAAEQEFETTAPSCPPRSKPKRLFQSYSHPDTDFVFTDENKHPSRESIVLTHSQRHADAVIKSRGGKVEIKHPKRSSSPNIGHYTLDVAVHPDILVKISPKHSPALSEQRKDTVSPPPHSARSAQQRRRWLQRSNEIDSGGSTSDSDPFLEVQLATVATEAEKIILKTPGSPSLKSPSSPTNAKLPSSNTSTTPPPTASKEDISFNAAQRYFAESGILGPINTSSNLIRKTSKILQDSNVIEKIRKTSMILRGNSSLAFQRKASTTTNTTTGTTPSPTSTHPTLSLYNANMELPATIIYAQAPPTPTTPKSPHTIATTCGFSPNLTTQSSSNTDDRDAQIKSLQGEIVSLKDVIKSRDAEIVKLRREIHKLKSVLQQTTNHIPIAHDELLQSPTTPPPLQRCHMPQQCAEISSSNGGTVTAQPTCAFCRRQFEAETQARGQTSGSNGSLDSSNSSDYNTANGSQLTSSQQSTNSTSTTAATCALAGANGSQHGSAETLDGAALASESLPGSKPKFLKLQTLPVLKKQGVSGESCETSMQQSINEPIPRFDKDFSAKQLIKDAIMDNDFLKNIDSSQVRELVESMYSLSVAKGEFVVREGEAGAHLYVSATGDFEVVKNGKVLGVMGPGKAFGELAILYNCTRTASIRVLSDARVWVLDRRVFQQIMMRTGMQRIENSVNFLKSVPLLKNLSVEVLAKIADVLEVEFYPAGTYIIRQGASGDTFFLISQGTVQVTQKIGPSSVEKEIRTLERGDYFGEQALINEDKRTANIIAMAPGVECLTLDRDSFTHLIGDLCELKEKNYGDESRVLAMKYAETKEIFGAKVQQEFPDMKLTDLEVVATLGIGGFGRVELVKAYRDNRVDTFALKCLKKRHIVDTKQEEHVFSERTIMLTCQTPFICRLYRTFRDEKYVYMLLEACMGGEIWTMLRDRGSFDENATQFIIGCVLQAFEYLHARGIIYRDLKPENLMLDERGYVKLVDFGFAKYIGNSSKTWTFCGTPEYVAPEIILNKGHDRAVDYWALGILIHELLNGTPPFTANDPMMTYNIILKGIDMINFPKHMTRSAMQLIKKLCRDVPAERLGYQKGGIQDIKKHKWFLGFDWDGLQSQLLIPPFVRPISHATDTCYFDRFPCDPNEPPDELTGWDAEF